MKMKMQLATTPICDPCAVLDGAAVPATTERNGCPVCDACAEASDQAEAEEIA